MADLSASMLPWASLALLGAFHGVNPGMGWLFAVALGLQERSRGAVLRALGPIALGHAVSVGVVAAAVAALQLWLDLGVLKTVSALLLLAFGLYRLLGGNLHPRWVGMRVSGRDLVVWSFLMATAHGAGLMLTPVLLRLSSGGASVTPAHAASAGLDIHAGHQAGGHAGHHAGFGHAEFVGSFDALQVGLGNVAIAGELIGVLIHTVAMLLVMAIIAVVVFDRLGLAILRRAWVNVDRLWAGALVGAGALTLLA